MTCVIRDYVHWEVSLHENQGYLGRCVVWCKREDAAELMDATGEEWAELFLVLTEAKTALSAAFQPDWFNYAFLGNGVRHLHCHLIPRYASPREFGGVLFTDERYGHNYRTDHNFLIPEETHELIRNAVVEAFPARR